MATKTVKKYELCLRWGGMKDTPKLRGAFKQCKEITMFKASEPVLVDHDEFEKLVKAGKVRPSKSYWGVSKGQIGMITLTDFGNPAQWEMVSNCKHDFTDGWDAAMKANRGYAE